MAHISTLPDDDEIRTTSGFQISQGFLRKLPTTPYWMGSFPYFEAVDPSSIPLAT